MNKYQQAADNIRKLSQMFKGLLDLNAELERVGSLDQVASECEARANLAKVNEENARESLAQVLDKVGVAERALNDAIGRARKVGQNADEQAARAVAEGKAKAQVEADAILAAATKRQEAIERDAAAARKALTELNEQITERTADLKRINSEIENVRKRIGVV